MTCEVFLMDKVTKALAVAYKFNGVDGAHHKDWVIDQMVRELTGENYPLWVENYCTGEEGPNTYTWNTGIAP